MSQRRSSRLQEVDKSSSPAKTGGKNSTKSTPKKGINTKSEKATPNSKAKKSSTDEKNPPVTEKNNRRKSDQKSNSTNKSTDKSRDNTPAKRGQKRKAPSDENEGPKNKRQKTEQKKSDDDDDVVMQESSSSRRKSSGKAADKSAADEKVDEILDIRAEQWNDIDNFNLSQEDDTGNSEKMPIYNSLTDRDVNTSRGQVNLSRTTAVVKSNGKKVAFNAYSDLLSTDQDDDDFLTDKYGKESDNKQAFFSRLQQRLQGMNDDERRTELKRIAEFLAKKKGRKLRVTDNTNYPMQSTPAAPKPKKSAPKTAPALRTNALRNPTSPTRFTRTPATSGRKGANKSTDAASDESEEDTTQRATVDLVDESPRKGSKRGAATRAKEPTPIKITLATPKKGTATTKAAAGTPNKGKAVATPNSKVTRAAATPSKATPKAKATPKKTVVGRAVAAATPQKGTASPKKATPKKSAKKSPAKKNSRPRGRGTRLSL